MSTKETFRERRSRGTTSENERRSRRLSVSSQRKRPKEREKYTQQSLRKHLFLVRFCFPAVLCTDRNSYTKERKNEVYSSLLLSSINSSFISSSRITRVCRLRDAYRSGSFIGISFVFITGLDAERRSNSTIPTTKK